MEVVIEPAKESDVPVILDIMKTANMHNVPSPEMPDLDWRCYFVAKMEGKIIGAAGYKILSDTKAKTTLMVVHPEYRRFGIGRMLQERRMLAMSEQGIEKLETNADIPETIAWYKKHFGYREVGKLKKVHEFGRPDIDEWTTLQTGLSEWKKKYDKQGGDYDR
jgi:ribosomal-protein-alanine N-acetyltransferase